MATRRQGNVLSLRQENFLKHSQRRLPPKGGDMKLERQINFE